ncbi:MAG: rhodoquinone biosynthesis methyltransferase RquA [bacterium]|nr:rhodoquinone biosynthesis methyltransferase RquA [bacterium]
MADTKVVRVPDYVEDNYWWAYARPWAMYVWDYQWTVNAILLGNYNRLRNVALREFETRAGGRTLQVGCCYGDLTPHLAARIKQSGGSLDVIDVLPVQVANLERKLMPGAPVHVQCMDAAALDMNDASYDTVIMFMLIHEQPREYRERTVSEAFRVLKPGGKLIVIDYAQASPWHIARFTTIPIYSRLKPYAVDVWNHEMSELIPDQMAGRVWKKESYFGGLFQKLVTTK